MHSVPLRIGQTAGQAKEPPQALDEELPLALEGFPGADIENYLDTETGEIIPVHDDCDDAAETRERIDAGLPGTFLFIEPLEAHEGFRMRVHPVGIQDYRASTLAHAKPG